MATRINTKFVIILACVLVVLTGGGALMLMSLTKSAAEHVAIANQALKEGESALQEGDRKTANNRFLRASRNFYFAKNKDGLNTEHLYNFIQARNKITVDDLTLAYNEIATVLTEGAAGIHDTPNASDEDRAYLYDTLIDWHRMRPTLNAFSPIGQLNNYTTKRLANAPNDEVALRYQAIGNSYLAGIKNEADERVEILEYINAAIQADPEDAQLHIAHARFHIGNARRQLRADGNAFSEMVETSFKQALASLDRASELTEDDPAALLDILELKMNIIVRGKESAAELSANQVETAQQLRVLLADKAMRDKLYTEELSRCMSYFLALGSGVEGQPFEGSTYARTLAETAVADRPGEPAAHAILVKLHSQQRELPEASKQAKQGLAIERATNGQAYVRDQQARLDMLSSLSAIKIDLATTQASDPDARKALYDESAKLIDQLSKIETRNTESRDARVDFVTGRLKLALGQPEEAVVLLNRANQTYNGRDLQTLRYLAQSHRLLKNTSTVIDLYEQIVQLRPNTSLRLDLVNLYLSQRQEDQLNKAEQHLEVFLRQSPDNLTAVRLKASLLSLRGDAAGAIQLLQAQDTDAHPELLQDISRYQAAAGDPSGIIKSLRASLTEREPGKPMSLVAVTQLIQLLPEKQERLAEIARLEEAGLDNEVAGVFREMVENGGLTLENELKLLNSRDLEPFDLALRKLTLYGRRNQMELARESLAEASRLEPKNPQVIEWRYKIALMDEQWEQAERAIADMMSLPAENRREIAVAGGAFMRARVQAAKAMKLEDPDARDKLLRDTSLNFSTALKEYPFNADGWLQLGKIQIIQKNYYAAQQSLREALALQSKDIEVLENMALAEIGSGDYALAMQRYQQILQIKPNHPTAINQFAKLAAQVGQDGDSIAIREQVRQRRPKDTDNRRALALLYARNKMPQRAKAEIDAVIALEGATMKNTGYLSQVLLTNGQTQQAIQVVEAYIKGRGDALSWQDTVVLAEIYEQAGRAEQADEQYAKAVALEGEDSVRSTQIWAKALLARGQSKQAAELFEKLSARQPDNIPLKTKTAELLIRNGNAKRGEALAEQLPNSPARHLLLIQSSLVSRQSTSATIALARKAVKDFPDSMALQLQLGRLLLAEERSKDAADRSFSEVQGLAKQLSGQFLEQVEVSLFVADVLLARGRTNEAVKQLEKILEFAPSHLPTSERLSNLWLQQANALKETDKQASTDRAIRALEIITRLIKSRPDQHQLNRSAGLASTLAGRNDLATEFHRKAFETFGTPQDMNNYAAALLEEGRGPDARRLLENPDHAGMVSDNLFLRALRGRALAMSGEPAMAAALFSNTLRIYADDPKSRTMLLQQAAASFVSDPNRFMAIADQQFGENPPADVELIVSAYLQITERYEDIAKRLMKYENNPLEDPRLQLDLLLRLALARQQTDQFEKAKASYELALDLVEKHQQLVTPLQKAQMLNNLAHLLSIQMQGYEQQAVKYGQQALKALPKDATDNNRAVLHDTLGWAFYKAGRPKDAIKYLERSVAFDPYAANQLHLGRVHLSEGNADKAVLLLDAARKMARIEKDTEMIEQAQAWFEKASKSQP